MADEAGVGADETDETDETSVAGAAGSPGSGPPGCEDSRTTAAGGGITTPVPSTAATDTDVVAEGCIVSDVLGAGAGAGAGAAGAVLESTVAVEVDGFGDGVSDTPSLE